VHKIIGLYNHLRQHQSISYLSPQIVHTTGIKTERKWKKLFLMHKNTNVFQAINLVFLRHKTPKITVKKDCQPTILPYCNFVQVKSITGWLLPGRACFRFNLTKI
jgi:hypothetical protein